MKNTMLKDTLILLAITLAAGLLLGLVFQITKEPIALQEQKTRNESCMAVMPEATSFNEAEADLEMINEAVADAGLTKTEVKSVLIAVDDAGEEKGYVVDVSNAEGYGGDVEIMCGIAEDGSITGISFLSLSETAGMGMKAKEPEFYTQFNGILAEEIIYSKTGKSADNEIDAISGATVTTKAVVKDVNAALLTARLVEEGMA